MYYFAYGSNLNIEQMSARCPAAEPICRLVLPDARLVFRGVADVEHRRGARCHGGLWRITEKCEKALDRYEGVSSGLYYKDYFTVSVRKGPSQRCLVYRMTDDSQESPPWFTYLDTIRQGYEDFGLPKRPLERAVARAMTGLRRR